MDKSNLLTALKTAKPALGGNLISGLDSYHILGDSVAACNGSLLIRTKLDQPFPIDGSLTGETFLRLINELPKEIDLSVVDGNLIVKSGKSKTTFPVVNVDTAFLADAEETAGFTYLPTQLTFAAGLKRCMSTVGGKGIPQNEVGVHVFIDTPPMGEDNTAKSECRMYSSNGSTFSRYIFSLEEEMPLNQVFLPASFCENLLFMYSELEGIPDEIVLTQKYVRALFGNTQLRHNFYTTPVNWELRNQIDTLIESVALVPVVGENWSNALKRTEIIAGKSTVAIDYGGPEGKLILHTRGNKNQLSFEELDDTIYPASGRIHLDVKSLRASIDSCKEVGFGDGFILLVGKEGFYDLILAGKS